MAITGSMGTTRPMKKVTAARPRSVVIRTMTNWATFLREERRALACPPLRFMTAETIEASVLLRLGDVVVAEGRTEDEVVHVLAHGGDFRLLQEDHERAVVENRLLKLLVHLRALLAITLHHGSAGLGGQRARIPGIAPGERLRLRIVRVVVVG